MMYLGDFDTGKVVRFIWNSNDSNGASVTRSTNGTISVYKDLGTTQSTSGVTDTEDFDTTTGIHAVAIDLASDGTFYSAGSDFAVVLTGATIDTRTVNAVLAHFSIRNRYTGQVGIKKNIALSNFEFFMRDSADHVSPKTGLTVTAERSLDGAAFAACTNSVSEVSNGVYKINLAAGDVNAEVLTLKFTATGADATYITIRTQV